MIMKTSIYKTYNRRERNKLSARKCRLKKKVKTQNMIKQIEQYNKEKDEVAKVTIVIILESL